MGLEARSLTRLLKSMEEKGLIFREADKVDKRSVRIRLTEKGREKRRGRAKPYFGSTTLFAGRYRRKSLPYFSKCFST